MAIIECFPLMLETERDRKRGKEEAERQDDNPIISAVDGQKAGNYKRYFQRSRVETIDQQSVGTPRATALFLVRVSMPAPR